MCRTNIKLHAIFWNLLTLTINKRKHLYSILVFIFIRISSHLLFLYQCNTTRIKVFKNKLFKKKIAFNNIYFNSKFQTV